jgi:predicted nucleotidyltransferase
MTNTLLDFSLRSELALHTRVVADVEAAAAPMGIAPLIVGAFARDLHLLYRCGVKMQRQTEDIDFALAVPDWSAFGALRERLIDGGAFRAQGSAAQRLWHTSGLPVDLVPFGGIETDERKIAWPPRGEFAMDVFGFREALATAHPVLLPGQVHTRLVSLPALTVLKIMCWQDRHYQSPRKDAHDLQMILRHYLAADNESRLYGDFVDWTQSDDFDYELAGPRMLGYDIRQLLDATGQKQVARLLQQQIDPAQPGRLPNEMNASEPDRALAWLNALMRGLLHT